MDFETTYFCLWGLDDSAYSLQSNATLGPPTRCGNYLKVQAA